MTFRCHTFRLRSLLPLIATLSIAFLTACHPPGEISEGAQLILSTPQPGPATTFEVRFDEPMVASGRRGVAAESPLIITPQIPGAFTWISPRSGEFVPSQPLAMDCRYEISLKPGLRNAEGKRVRASLRRFVATPSFEIVASSPKNLDRNLTASPRVSLLFNSEVDAASAAKFCEFQNADGRRVTAVLRQGKNREMLSSDEVADRALMRTWQQQFQDARSTERRARWDSEQSAENLVVVAPAKPLPVGNGWRLEVKQGVPAREGAFRTRKTTSVLLGDVTPFTFCKIEAENIINRSPSVDLEFSKYLHPSLTNDWTNWVHIEPAPDNLHAVLMGKAIHFTGNFSSTRSYKVGVGAGLPAMEPFCLEKRLDLPLTIPQVKPRLYFPAFSTDQLAVGRRTLPLQVVNVEHVRVRAKLLDPQTAIHALSGYNGYIRTWEEHDDWKEPYRRLEYNLVPGRTVYSEGLDGSTETDVPANIVLNWDNLLGGRKTGVAFVEAERNGLPRLGTQALIQLTDLGMVWKTGESNLDVFVFSYSTGKPVAGAIVRRLGPENEVFGEATTDTNGVARLADHDHSKWLMAVLGDDFHAVNTSERQDHAIPLYSFHLPSGCYHDGSEGIRALLFTDRDAYRPGETLYLKTVVRDWNGESLAIPSCTTNRLVFLDARGRKFLETNLVFNPLGAADISLPLAGASRGHYIVELQVGGRTFERTFQVQDFAPNSFEISLQTKSAYAAGEKIDAPLSARYYFGKPLSGARVKWSLELDTEEFKAAGVEQFSFRRARVSRRFDSGTSTTLTGEQPLSGASNCVIAPNLPPPPTPGPRLGTLHVDVTDVNQQTITRQASFMIHSSDFYLGLRTDRSVIGAGTNLALAAAGVGADGQLWKEAIPAQLKLQRVEWHSVLIEGAGKTECYRNEMVLSNIFERTIQITPAVRSTNVMNDVVVTGMPVAGIAPVEPGEYLVEITAHDSGGREVVSSTEFSVTAPANLAWDYRNSTHITLKPDKKVYAPGETAVILVETPISGSAWVTTEREQVRRSFVTRLEGNAPSIRVPITATDVPNVFVSVTLVRGSEESAQHVKEPEFRVGYCELRVENPRDRLDLQIASASTNYLPGQSVQLAVDVRDCAGAAVPDAEVTLYAVDEGILSLTEAELPDPYSCFYKTRPLLINSAISMRALLPEDPEELSFANKGYTGGDGNVGGRVRKNFLACAFWNASLRTGVDGKVAASFSAPDAVTRYRVIAVAHTADNRFGNKRSAFQVSKPLLIEPALPRFGNVSDRIIARAVVYNQTAQAGDVVAGLKIDATAKADRGDSLSRKVSIAAHGSAVVEFPVQFVEPGTAKWVFTACFSEPSSSNFTDSVQSTFNVGYVSPMLREVLLARVAVEQTNLLAQANPQLLAGKGKVTVTVANTRLNELGDSAGRLLHYPYGCVEQTSSSLLPWIVLNDAPQVLASALHGGLSGLQAVEPKAAIRSGIARLFSMQTASGGLSYWPGQREPMWWGSAYAAMVLATARNHNFELPEDDFSRLLDYLSEQLRSSDTASTSDACLTLYALALAGRPEPAYHEKFFGIREQLARDDRALLALAISESKGSSEMVSELLKSKAGRLNGHGYFSGRASDAAIEALASIAFRPDAPETDAAIDDLVHVQKDGNWQTTQGNAWALLALSEYARRVESTRPAVQGVVRWQDQSTPFALSITNTFATMTFSLTNNTQEPALVLLDPSKTRVFTTVALETRSPLVQQPRQEHGFVLVRRYERLDDANHRADLKNLRVGDRVLVTLKLTVAEAASYVVLDDALPSTFEAINPEFKTQQTADVRDDEIETLSCDYRELRTDRALFFCDQLEPGTYVVKYLARVRAAGTVTAPSAKVEEMYHPDRFGLTETPIIATRAFEEK